MFCMRNMTTILKQSRSLVSTRLGMRPLKLVNVAPLFGLLGLTTFLLLAPLGAGAQCSGGGSGSGGGPTINVPIAIDGNPSDWAPVLSNPLQVTHDGQMCGTTDRDCATPSQGRDLDTFAWTWNDTNVYLYLKRYGSTNNQQMFYFFMDTNANQRMNTGEKVYAVNFQGSNRSTDGVLWTYTASATYGAAGDPMVSPITGFADGFSISGGSLSNPVTIYTGLTAGFLDGTGFEAYVPWSDVGVPSGTPIYYHVSSSNGNSGSLVDNLGGPDGKIGAFAYYGVSISSATPQTIAPNASSSQTVLYSHTLTNTGTLPDSYTLKAVSSAGFQVELLDAGLSVLAVDYTGDGTWETGSGALPPSGTLGSGSPYLFYIRLTVPAGTDNLQDVTTLTATSTTQSCALASAKDTTTIGTITLLPSPQAKSGIPSQYAEYTLTLFNGGGDGTFTLSAASSLGYTVQFPSGTSVSLAHGESAIFTVRVYIPSMTIPQNGTGPVDTTTVTAQGPGSAAQAVLTTTVRNQLTLTPSYTVAANTNMYSGPSGAVAFAHTLINSGTGTFTVNSTSLTAVSSHGWTVLIYTDPNGDGNPSDGQLIDSSYSSTLAAFGGTLHLVAEVIVPAIATNLFPVTDTTTVTASGSGASTTASDQVVISYLAIFKDANHTLANRYFVPCDTIYALGGSLVADTTTRYQIRFKTPGGTYPYQPVVPSDGNGQASASYTLPSGSSGTWTVELYDGATKLDSVLVYVEPLSGSSTITGVATGQASYALSGDNLSISATFNNANTQAAYSATTFRYLVRNDATTSYLVQNTSGGTSSFATYTAGTGQYTLTTSPHTIVAGASVTETVSVSNVNFSPGGTYRVDVDWVGPCGNVIATATVVRFPAGTSLASYLGSSPEDYFVAGSTVTLGGTSFLASTSYKVWYYDGAGQLQSSLTTGSVTSGSDGSLDTTLATGSLTFGVWRAVVYPSAAIPPSTYVASDPMALSSDWFAITPAAPTVTTNPILAGATNISGTSSAPAGTAITLYSNGTPIGSATVQFDGTWTVTGLSGLVGGESITAKAGPPGALSPDSNAVVVTPAPPAIIGTLVAGDTSVSGTGVPGASVTVTIGGSPYTTTVSPEGNWTVTGVTLVGDEAVSATQAVNGQTSPATAATVHFPAPSVTGPIYSGASSVSGTSTLADGQTVTVYSNGTAIGTALVSGGSWILTDLDPSVLVAGSSITAVVAAGTSAASAVSNTVTVDTPALPALLRVQWTTTISGKLTPPDQATVFPNSGSDPALPTSPQEVASFASSASFPNQTTDAADATIQVVFYQLQGNTGSTLRVAKSGGNVVITY